MELDEAVKKATGDFKVMSLDNYFLASIFSITEDAKAIGEWTLLFYNPKTRTTRDCFVNDRFVTLGEEADAQKEMAELNINDVKIGVHDAVKEAKKLYHKKSINILITLHMAERLAWTITFVGTDITATSYEIDAKTGKLLREQTTSLMKRV